MENEDEDEDDYFSDYEPSDNSEEAAEIVLKILAELKQQEQGLRQPPRQRNSNRVAVSPRLAQRLREQDYGNYEEYPDNSMGRGRNYWK